MLSLMKLTLAFCKFVLFIHTIAITVGLTSDDWNTCRVTDSERQATAGF
jgi:hypothetical protein